MVALAGRLRAPFARYWLSEFLSSFGNGVRLAAFPLLAAQLTRSPGAVSRICSIIARTSSSSSTTARLRLASSRSGNARPVASMFIVNIR